jgi:hypothetical protein
LHGGYFANRSCKDKTVIGFTRIAAIASMAILPAATVVMHGTPN